MKAVVVSPSKEDVLYSPNRFVLIIHRTIRYARVTHPTAIPNVLVSRFITCPEKLGFTSGMAGRWVTAA